MQQVRLGIIGTGSIVLRRHLTCLVDMDGVRIVALHDTDPEHLNRAARRTGTRAYADLDEFLEADMEAVLIASPADVHAKQTIRALDRGLAVLVEKPPAVKVVDVEEMVAKAEETGGIAMCGFQKRWAPAYQYLKRRIEEPDFHFTGITIRYNSGRWTDIDEAMVWHHIHGYDLALYFGGPVERIRAMRMKEEDSRGCYQALVEFRSGVIGTITTSGYYMWNHPFERVEISGDREYMVVEDVLKRYHYRESQEAMEAFESTFSSQKYSNNYYEGFLPQWRHFIECVQKKEKPRYSLAESLESLKLVYAALISATRDEEVILDALGAEDYAEISISNETKGG